jgi:hypothetical protein
MAVIIVLLVFLLVIGVFIYFRKVSPGSSKLVILKDKAQFPEVSGYNLDRRNFSFPSDFEGDLNLLIVAFKQNHPSTVNTWIPHVQKLEREFPGMVYYELPTIKEMSLVSRTFINEGMRAGIPDQTARERTVTLYIDKERFNAALNIPDEEDIQLFLVDTSGRIIWREKGGFDGEKGRLLQEILQERMAE